MELIGCFLALSCVTGCIGIFIIKNLERIYYTLEKIERNQRR